MKFNQMILDDILTFKRGHDLPHSQRVMGEIPVVSSSGITGFHNEYICDGEGVITGRYGTLGEIHYVNGKYWPLNTTLYVTDFKSNFPKFIYFFLKTIDFEGANSAGAVPGINRNNLKNIVVKIPDLETQKKIASILSNYDDLIQTNQQRIALLEEAAQRLYDEWFVKLRFPNHEQVPVVDGVPEGWVLGTVGDFYETSSGGTPSRNNKDYYNGEIFWVRTQELNGNFIFDTSEKITKDALKNSSAKIFPENTVLVAMYGVTIGELAILGVSASTNQACCAILEKHECSSYIHAYLFFIFNKQGLLNIAQGSAQTNVSQQVIKAFPMIMPPLHLMTSFVNFCKPIFQLKKNLELQNQKLAQARDDLLPRLMSGKMDVSGLRLKEIA